MRRVAALYMVLGGVVLAGLSLWIMWRLLRNTLGKQRQREPGYSYPKKIADEIHRIA